MEMARQGKTAGFVEETAVLSGQLDILRNRTTLLWLV
jgi:hypothetical protein